MDVKKEMRLKTKKLIELKMYRNILNRLRKFKKRKAAKHKNKSLCGLQSLCNNLIITLKKFLTINFLTKLYKAWKAGGNEMGGEGEVIITLISTVFTGYEYIKRNTPTKIDFHLDYKRYQI